MEFSLEHKEPQRSMLGKVNIREELDAAVKRLKLTIRIKPISILAQSKKKEARDHLNGALAQIDLAERQYFERLSVYRSSGALSAEDYNQARFKSRTMFDPFERMRDQARKNYSL
ncbi:hypothetical protein HYT24_02305 [Candidatus Pacearchaeota archaeon]|nr:hypothetical protein [Candidatus Pacearchaeota archaeon]